MNAPDKAREIKAALTLAISFLTALWGWQGWAVAVFIAAMAVDYITGTWAARARGEWSSAAARAGLWHKLGEITALLVAALCDIAIRVVLHSTAAPMLGELPERHYLTLIVAIWYSFTELGSIVENAGLLGAPIPQWLKKGIALLEGIVLADVPEGSYFLSAAPLNLGGSDGAPCRAYLIDWEKSEE